MFYTDNFEDNFNFDWYRNDNYNWNSEPIAVAETPDEREDASQMTPAFADRVARYWQQNFDRSADEILLDRRENFDSNAYRITAADTESSTDFDRLTGEAIAQTEDGRSDSGDGETPNNSEGQVEVKVAAAPDLSGRGRPTKGQTDASSHYAAPTPTAAPITSPDSVS